MIDYTKTGTDIRQSQLRQLVFELANSDGVLRRHARRALERVGKDAAPYLINALESPDANVRWEAAKALGRVIEPTAAPALVTALMDESFEIQWLAAEALIALGRTALKPLLEGLIEHYGSVYMRQGAHHVLHDLERRDLLEPPTRRVLDALRCLEPPEPYPDSARRALRELRKEERHAVSANRN
jgi:hypothetical protein